MEEKQRNNNSNVPKLNKSCYEFTDFESVYIQLHNRVRLEDQ